MYSALVLAGGDSFCLDKNGKSVRAAMLEVGGRAMLVYIVEALEKSCLIDNIFVAGADCPAGLNCSKQVKAVGGGASLAETLALGVAAAGLPEKILLVTADIPLVSGRIIDEFICECKRSEADFYYPVIKKSVMRAMFPTSERTYFRLSDGVFTGGNIFLARSASLSGCQAAVRKITLNRKKPWRLAAMLGWVNLAKFICGRMSVRDAQCAADSILGIKTCAFNFAYAQIGMDIDKQSDVTVVENYLKENLAGHDVN